MNEVTSEPICCSPWGHKESDTTWRLNNNEWNYTSNLKKKVFIKQNLIEAQNNVILLVQVFLSVLSYNVYHNDNENNDTVTPLIYYFLTVAVTNYHKLSGRKQHKFIILQFWRSEVQNRPHWAEGKVSAGLRSF